MEFRKYQHIERFGNEEVLSIELGLVHIFPKIDGTNGSVWINGNTIKAGSRKRELSLDNDNAGFYEYLLHDDRIKNYLSEFPNHRLFGEWLVPHSLKTYKPEAWRKFYVFDVAIDSGEELEYLPYDNYKQYLDKHDLEYIPCIIKIKNADYESLIKSIEKTGFLIQDGQGNGEGIVIKNYGFHNKFGRQIWAKIVTNEFKEKHYKEMGAIELNGRKMIEEEIINKFCTLTLINKTYAKIVNENDGWSSKRIPQLLNTVYYNLVNEEIWQIVKEFKQPTINFKTLTHLVTNKVKELKNELF